MIYRSTGESGNDEWYANLAQSTAADRLTTKTLGYWDNTTQTAYSNPLGVGEDFSQGTMHTDDDTQFLYWLYGDLDSMVIVTKLNNGTYYIQYLGKYDSAYTTDQAITSGNVTSGSSKLITVDNSSYFTVGKYYYIYNSNAVNGEPERFLVSSKDDGGTNITADSRLHLFTYGFNYTSNATIYGWACRNNSGDAVGAVKIASNTYQIEDALSYQTAGDYNKRIDLYQLWPLGLYDNTEVYQEYVGSLRRIYSVSTTGLSSEDTITVGGQTYKYFLVSFLQGVCILEA
jgi:hypothetical protein